MEDNYIEFSIPLDDDGFVNLECPYCEEEFKLVGSDFENPDYIKICCPLCGLSDNSDAFFDKETIEHIHGLAANHMKSMINSTLKDMEKSFSRNKNISFKVKNKLKNEEPKEINATNNFTEIETKCCQIKIKASSKYNILYCPVCGVNI